MNNNIFQSIVETTQDGFMLLGTSGEILDVNAAYCTMSGYRKAELLTMSVSDVALGKSRRFVEDHIRKIRDTGNDRFESVHRKKDGSDLDVEVSVTYLAERKQFVAFFRDISERKQHIALIQRSAERLQLALEGADLGLWDWDMQTNEVYFSPKYFSMLGYGPTELPHALSTWEDLLHPEEKEPVKQHIFDCIENGTGKWSVEFRLRAKNGSYQWILGRGKIVHSSQDGTPLRASGTHLDITTVKKAEKALTESEQRFRSLVDDLPEIAVQGYDCDRNVICWNRASVELYGYSEEEALGKKLEDLIIPDPMKEPVIQAIHNWHEHDVAIPSGELLLKRKDGGDVPVYSSHVMLTSSRGVKEMYCIDMDLSDLKMAQEKEKRSESLYRQLFDHSTSGVAVYEAIEKGRDFIFKDFNKAGEEIESVKKDTLLGRKVTEIFPGVEEFGLLDVFRSVWLTGEPAFHPVSWYEDGMLQGWRENRVYKLPTGNIVAVYDDVTKQKQLEAEKKSVETRLHRAQKMEAIGLLAGGVAHDLNNILTGITGYPELLLLTLPEESDLRQPIMAIKESGERAAAVVADLLTVARGVASTRVVVSLNSLLDEYLGSPEWRQLHAENQHIRCEKTVADNLPDISCSPVHIKKCIMNLVTNGVEAIEGSGAVTLSTECLCPDLQWAKENALEHREYVVLGVSDTGTGISKRDIEHIFEPFYSKKVMGRSGTGLGLAVVWNTVEDHGGKIFVESSEEGTQFQLYFPAISKKSREQAAAQTKEKIKGNNEHILVVDDEALLRDIASKMLQAAGYRVDTVSSGELAIQYLEENSVDLIVLDMLMEPGMNGYQTYKEILKLNPEQKAVIASGFSESGDVKAALAIGAAGFIKKPYSMDVLARTVSEALRGRHG